VIRLRKILDVIINAPMVGLITGVLCSGAIVAIMITCGWAPRDEHPERTPTPMVSCNNFSCR
jgi:multisubunit Na+/H+ antiporter MnhB subunit